MKYRTRDKEAFVVKMLRKLTVFCTVVALLMTLWVPAAAAQEAATEEFYFGRSILSQMSNGEALCHAYDRLVEGCQAQSGNVDISHPTLHVDRDETSMVYRLVMADHPEFFWLANGISMSGYVGEIISVLTHVPADVADLTEALDARVAELTADLEGKSDYEKSLILHDRVADAVVYAAGPNHQTVVGSLLDGVSVCAGYARAYQLLMQTVGIPTFYVSGESKGVGHAWNLVKLDGEWYYTDVTWDDQNDDGGTLYHAYLNITYDRMAEDHTVLEFDQYLPRSTATANHYHLRNDRLVSAFDAEELAAILRRGNPGAIYVTGDLNAYIADLRSNIRDVVSALVPKSSGYSFGYSYMGRELFITLTVKHTHTYEAIVVEPTCTTDGSATTLCSQCGAIDTVVTFPASGHDLTWFDAKEPTCQEEGWDAYEECTNCDYTTFAPLSGACRYVVDEVVAPTCQDGGYTRYVCTECGDTYEDDFTDIGDHDFSGAWEYNDEFHYITCAHCDNIEGYDLHAFGGDHVCDVCGYATAPAFTYGDLNDDGRINNRDLGLLQQHLADWDVSLNRDACDLNNDGRVNNRDLGLLQQYLADWDVTFG